MTDLAGYEKNYISKCTDCGFVFCKKIPSEKELTEYYSNNYNRTDFFSPITRNRYNELLDEFEQHRKTGKILDLGCGYGFFLEVAKERGWEVYGAEIAEDAVKICREKGVKMFSGRASKCDFPEASFDVIVAIEVIEHLEDPKPFLSKSYELLRSGGLMYTTTPNFNSYLRYRLKGEYDVIEYPNHLLYFTRKTLRKLYNQHGFKTQKLTSTGISLTRLRTSKKQSNQDFVSETSDDEMMRYRIEKNSFLKMIKWSTNGILNTLKIGVTLKGSFIKP